MDAECDIVVMDFKALIPSLLQGKLDGVVSQITPTSERVGKVLFSRILLQNLYSFVIPVNSNYVFTKEGLHGVKIGLTRGGAWRNTSLTCSAMRSCPCGTTTRTRSSSRC